MDRVAGSRVDIIHPDVRDVADLVVLHFQVLCQCENPSDRYLGFQWHWCEQSGRHIAAGHVIGGDATWYETCRREDHIGIAGDAPCHRECLAVKVPDLQRGHVRRRLECDLGVL